MRRFLYAFFLVMMAIWGLTGGIHWGSASAMTVVAVIGAVVMFRARNPFVPDMENVAPTGEPLYTQQEEVFRFHGFGPLGWMLLAMILMTVFSLIPLPDVLLNILSPRAAQLYQNIAQATHDESGGKISVAPGMTAYALAMIVGFFAVFWTTMRIAGRRQTMVRMTHAMAGLGVLWVILMLLNAMGIGVSAGETGAMSPVHFGLPINPNHTGAVMSMLALMSLGAGLTKRHREAHARRALWIVLYIVFSIAVVMLKSRGAILGLVLGHVVLGGCFYMAIRQFHLKGIVVAVAGMGVVIAAAVYISAPTVAGVKQEYEETQISFSMQDTDVAGQEPRMLSKTQMYGDFVGMAQDWGRSGIGRSAFMDVYPSYQSFPFHKRFRHAENEYWEIVLEYGIPFGMVLLILGLFGIALLMRTCMGAKDERGCAFGLMAGVVAILVQNCFDFGLRYWTVGFPFWISCGILEGRRLRWKYGRMHHDDTPCTARQKWEHVIGMVIFAVGTLTAALTARAAYDGLTGSGLAALKEAVSSQDTTQQELDAVVRSNLDVRPHSVDMRKIIAFSSVRHSASASGDNKRMYLLNARAWYEDARRIAPRDPDVSMHLGKVCLALGDQSCAAQNFLGAAENNVRWRSIAMKQMSMLDTDKILVPKDKQSRQALVQALMKVHRNDAALVVISKIPDRADVAVLECNLYMDMDFPAGCDQVVESIRGLPVTIDTFRITTDAFVRARKFEELFVFMKAHEKEFKDEAEYWKIRLYRSAFYGKQMGDEWYTKEISYLLLNFRKYIGLSSNMRLDSLICESKYALEIGQFGRAERAAKQALGINPGNKMAQQLLETAQKKSIN